MSHAVARRGPDGSGVHLEPGLALAVRRLALVDPEHGAQPASNARSTIWSVCNGELFDHASLRVDLEREGHRFETACDAELWPHLYERWGSEVFARARGQFAVAIWDRVDRRLLLARDRSGICPLHYAEHDGWLLFASEAKALLASGWVDARPDHRAIDHLFVTMSAPREHTFFDAIRSIPPGGVLQVDDGVVTHRSYWSLDFPDAGDERRVANPDTLVDELDELLQRAVRRRAPADLPVASYLSGGVDSSLVLALSSAQSRAAAFTIGLDAAGPDERSLASATARSLRATQHVMTMDQRAIVDTYPSLITAVEGPVLDTSTACLLRLAERVRSAGHKAVLTGEGADELFAGYSWYKTRQLLDRFGVTAPKLLRGAVLRSIGAPSPGESEPRLGGFELAQLDIHSALARTRSQFYAPAMWARLQGPSLYSELPLPLDRMKHWHPLNRSLYLDHQLMLPGHLLLGKGDRVSMYAGVEARYPFLDEDVLEFASSVAPDYKLRGLRDKWLVRQVAARHLPREVAHRPKKMFRARLSSSLLGAHRPPWIDQLLSPASLSRTGFFEPRKVSAARAAQTRTGRWTPGGLTRDAALSGVVATQLWFHTFCGEALCELPRWQASGP